MGASPFILRVLERGLDLGMPQQQAAQLLGRTWGRSVVADVAARDWFLKELSSKISSGAYFLAPAEDAQKYCVTRMFLVPKPARPNRPAGSFRLINDLRPPNAPLPDFKFKYEGLSTLAEMLRPGWWFATLDLLDAYQHIGLTAEASRFVCYEWEGLLIVSRVLPFGLKWAPWIFTKVMRVPLKAWRQQGIFVILYLDDLIVVAPTKEQLVTVMARIRADLDALGIAVNEPKSAWFPQQSGSWLGVGIDTNSGLFTILPQQVQGLMNTIDSFLEAIRRPSQASADLAMVEARAAAKLAGRIVCWQVALAPALLVTRELFNCMAEAHGNFGRRIRLSVGAIEDLEWLRANLSGWNGRRIWRRSQLPSLRLRTDASGLFWAAILDGTVERPGTEIPLRGALSPSEQVSSSTFRELLAVRHALVLLAHHLENQAVLLLCDSQSTVGALLNGASPSPACWPLVREVGRLALTFGIELLPTWVPREQNAEADFLTRVEADPGDWTLDPAVFRQAQALWPELAQPSAVDRFGSMDAPSQLPRFNTRFYHPRAEAVNCYGQDWSKTFNWMVPPFSQVGRALKHMCEGHSEGVLVHPRWESAPWWPLLESLRVGAPVPIPAYKLRPGLAPNPEPFRSPSWTMWMSRVASVSRP
jgi:hypothetical protein